MLPTIKSTNAAPSAFQRARERFAARKRPARIGFLVDATGSRFDTWENAQCTQARMFRLAGQLRALSLRLVHYGGGQLIDHGWMDSPRDVAAAMASVRCEQGLTQILQGLCAFQHDAPESRADAIILIGDCFEEDASQAQQVALALKQAGIRVFCFLEGPDWTAERVFRRIAEITGGKFAKFGSELPLPDLCQGVALLTAGGPKALKRLENKRARQLLLTGPSRR